MSEIERFARVLAVEFGQAKGTCDCRLCMIAVKNNMPYARAILTELREPSSEIVSAVADEGPVVGCCNIDAPAVREVIELYIDHLLKGQPDD